MQKVCITIPVYKKISDPAEILSLKQGLKIFADYPIIFVCPESFDENLMHDFLDLHPKISFEKFDNFYFKNAKTYSLLLLAPEFYGRFSQFEFMMIYQPDAYVFSDQLLHWCNAGFDYIGAPWFKKFDQTGKEKEFIEVAGNGGFSLRHVGKINSLMEKELSLCVKFKLRKILKKCRFKPHNRLAFDFGFFFKTKTFSEVSSYICSHSIPPHEDYFFAAIYPQIFPEFKSAKAHDAIAFAFECQPERLFEMNGNKLPFGCHAWKKYSPEFWAKFIK